MDALKVMQDLVQIHVPVEEDALVIEVDVAPGGGPPPLHTHPASEFFLTLEGTLTYFREDEAVSGGASPTAVSPGGRPHPHPHPTNEPAGAGAGVTPARQVEGVLL